MNKFFALIFGDRGPRSVRQSPRMRLGVEELTPRVLPSAGCGAAAGGASDSAAHAAFANPFDDGGSHGGGHDCGGNHGAAHATLAGTLSDSAGATGTASFNESAGSLYVTVKGATASTTLSVTFTDNGTTTTVGTVTTDASGDGHAKLTDVTAAAGDTIAVGDLTGTLAQVKFSAELVGTATGVRGSSSFNSVKDDLHVSIAGAADSTTYNVSINGTVVGQITTNKHGRGRLTVTPTGVTIASGSTISIADTAGDAAILTGTFA
jgi:hypothetical protein